MLYTKYFDILDESIKSIVLNLHPALQEDVINIIADLPNNYSCRQINKEVFEYLLILPDELINSCDDYDEYIKE